MADALPAASKPKRFNPITPSPLAGEALIPAKRRLEGTLSWRWPQSSRSVSPALERTHELPAAPGWVPGTEIPIRREGERALPHVAPDRLREAIRASLATTHYLQTDIRGFQLAVKRVVDVTVSATALVALVPLFGAVAALIKLGSPGPVFFGRERLGLGGKRFRMLKFRSMVAEAEGLRTHLAPHNESTGPVFKIKDDPRLTRLGRFLRKYSIDELPQLLNVLRGDMSLVGPRPPLASEVAEYDFWQLRRLSVRPGLTCIWQASPHRYRMHFEEWMQLDLEYIDNWSLRLDLGLILRTIPVVFRGTGQ